ATTCDVPCANFCNLSLAACTGVNALYDDMLQCFKVECATFGDANEAYAADPDDDTDSFRCRMYQLTQATLDSDHCPEHGGQNSKLGPSTICVVPLDPGTGGGGAGGE